MSFDTIASAANYLYKNGYYTGNAKTPIQAIVTMISNNIHGKTDKLVNCSNISFEYAPGTIKNTGGDFSAKSIYCPQIQKTFASEVEAAHYFIDNKIWNGIKFKTAKLRISDVVRGYFQDYRGYTFSVSQE